MSNLLEVQIDNISLFKDMIDLLKNIHNNVTFEFTRTEPTSDILNDMSKPCKSGSTQNTYKMNNQLNQEQEEEEEEGIELNSNDMPQKRKQVPQTTHNKKIKTTPVDEGYLKIMDVDATKTLLTSFKFKLKKFVCDFDLYDVNINLSELYSFLKQVQEQEQEHVLTMSVNKDQENIVLFEYDLLTWSYTQINMDKRTYKIPPITYEAVVEINSNKFYQICQGMINMSDYVHILVTPSFGCNKGANVTFTCVTDSSAHTFTYYNGEYAKIFMNGNKSVEGIFETQYLLQFAQCKNITTDVKLFLKKNNPLTFAITDDSWGKLLFALSPIDDTL